MKSDGWRRLFWRLFLWAFMVLGWLFAALAWGAARAAHFAGERSNGR